jgi:hypothetical protein
LRGERKTVFDQYKDPWAHTEVGEKSKETADNSEEAQLIPNKDHKVKLAC